MCGSIVRLWLHSFGFQAAVRLLRRNQKVNVIVLIYLRWIHSFFLPHLPFFLNCVTPEIVLLKSPLSPRQCPVAITEPLAVVKVGNKE